MQPRSSPAVAKVAGRPSATWPRQMQLHNLAPRPRPRPPPVRSWLHRHVLAPGAAESPAKPVWGRVRAPEPGSAPVRAVLCPRPSAAGAGAREEGGWSSAYLPLLTDKSRSVQRLARACLAADPGKPGAARSTPGRASAARLAGLARRKARLRGLGRLRPPPAPSTAAGPARPAPAPQLASLRPGSATRAGRQRFGRLRGRPRARSLAARRSQPQPPGSVLLRCPHLLQLSSARSRSRGREAGAERGREREGSPCSRPRVPATPRSRAAGGEGAGAARPPPMRPAGTEAGGAPGPAGRGRGRRGAGRAANVGWGIWSEWREGEWRSPRPRTPEPELQKEVEGAAAGCRLRAGIHRGASSGFLGCRRRCAARKLVESTLEPPPEQLEGWRSCVFSQEGSLETPRDGCLLCQPAQPSGALKSRSAGGLGSCPLTCGLLACGGWGQGRVSVPSPNRGQTPEVETDGQASWEYPEDLSGSACQVCCPLKFRNAPEQAPPLLLIKTPPSLPITPPTCRCHRAACCLYFRVELSSLGEEEI